MAPTQSARRLMKETAQLSEPSSETSAAFYAAPVSDSDLHEWHFTLLGPPAPSPYAGGLYHGRITLPPKYPFQPPNFRFLNPSGRFEVNRAICLSISGFHEETWQPAWDIRLALTALRTFMAEPGTAGQIGGLESSVEVRKRLAKESRQWRCETCGDCNEKIMRDWWAKCTANGITVDEEHIDLQTVPEGMTVAPLKPPPIPTETPRQPTVADRSVEAASDTAVGARAMFAPPETWSPSAAATAATSDLTDQSIVAPSAVVEQGSTTSRQREHGRTSPQAQLPPSASGAVVTSSQTSESNEIPSTSGFNSTATTTNRTADGTARDIPHVQHPPFPTQHSAFYPNRSRQDPSTTLSIDRAITIVFLALCLMVLKKIFYPSSGGYTYDDDLKMLKE